MSLYARCIGGTVALTDTEKTPDLATLTPDEARDLAVELLVASEDAEK